ncbi:acyltransferase [Sagittula sp. MA-2]|jgi:peptidoglycan/LPS O-acetylase OafA/YrhL|uniref:acyltransferase family protein n=1 Tax=Sagittula sp. MA-2 TaxID=3048007 RepID=UPI0024C2DA92|nr:acyltransferase [Sagittula sp. MA-2]WHZ37730.1 acyltransferase [Sagittula sp. MA-2]
MNLGIRDDNISANRFALIEAVRGAAAILVVWSHTIDKSGYIYKYIFDPGKIGVVIFFFISGYLVIPSAAKDGRLDLFIVKRFFRLYPLYWISLLLAYIYWRDDFSIYTWIANATMAQQLLGLENVIDVYWTLTIEFLLYIIVASMLFMWPKEIIKKLPTLILVTSLLCLLLGALRMGLQVKLPTAIPLGLLSMFVGAKIRVDLIAGRSIMPLAISYLAVVVPTTLMAYSFEVQYGETSSRYAVSYILGGLVFYFVAKFPNFNLGKHLRTLGHFSYGIYLFHLLFTYKLEPFLGKGPYLFCAVLAVSIAFSAPLYYYIERPAAEFGRILAGRRLAQP